MQRSHWGTKTSLGDYDGAVLASMLQGLHDDGGLLGTGYEEEDLAALLEELNPIFDEAHGGHELDEADFSDFEHKCPRCSFEFDS